MQEDGTIVTKEIPASEIYAAEPYEWETSGQTCPKCKREHVEVRSVESPDGGHEDYQYRCNDCNYSWWIDGIDS